MEENMVSVDESKKKAAQETGKLIGKIVYLFLSSAFILWGWNVLAPHLNAPLFGYWEIFAMRMAFSSIFSIIRYKN